VQQLLGSVFALRDFRPLQREVINATLQGRDVLCLLPSGGGKSLCYQLPALLGGSGLTLVVSPLLSLIQDQVLGMEALGVHAAALTSLTSKEDAAAISKQVDDASSGLRLLYVTPEKIVNSKRFFAKLEKVYKQGRLDRIAVDEAHCCSQWGNDFRPDYKKLGILKQQFPETPILALTATATQQAGGGRRKCKGFQACCAP
jgi:ATP-dependent DNA helicase Q1